MKTSISAVAPRNRKPLFVPGLKQGIARNDSAPGMVEVKAALDGIQRTFAAFKEQNDRELAELKKGAADVVTKETTDRINAELTELDKQLRELNTQMQVAAALRSTSKDGVSPEEAEYANKFREWLASGERSNAIGAELHPLAVKAAMTTQSKPDGGYLVPTQVETAITRVLELRSAMRGLASVMSIGTDSYTKLYNLGGATSGWVGEKETRPTTSGVKLSEREFDTHELYAMPAATQKLLDDSRLDIASWLAGEVNIKFAADEGDAFVNGTGIKKPKGFLAQTKVANGSWAWGKLGYKVSGVAAALSDASHNGADALIDLIHSLRPGYRTNGRFLMNDLTIATVRKLKNEDGDYLWQPSIQVGEPSVLLGYPVIPDDYMPDIGADKFPIAFADWKRGYLIVDRIGTRILQDPYSQKPYVLFYITKRVGGDVDDYEAIKLLKIGTS